MLGGTRGREVKVEVLVGGSVVDLREELARLGLSKREIEELLAKLASSPGDEEFDLDLSAARPAEHFAREMEAAVPRVDRR